MSSKWTAADVLVGEQRGHPKVVLWTVSEELTGVTYPV